MATRHQQRTAAVLSAAALGLPLAGGACAWAADGPGHAPGGLKTAVEPVTPAPPRADQVPRIDVVFALDTTGSMAGLIDGAKRKIWAVANRIVSGQPRPEVRIGLVAYRDRLDEYVTKLFPLTRDIDTIQEALAGLQANGGGDTPEDVNQALADAVRQMQWEQGDRVLRLLFLVGDAPPHEEYDDGLESQALGREAAQKGITVNAIRCGHDGATEVAWRAIAAAAGGEYASIAQDGGVVAVATPYDEELRRLNEELVRTGLAYGGGGKEAAARRRMESRAALAAPAAAEAAAFSAKADRLDSDDLVTAIAEGRAKLEELPAAALPEPMRAMSKPAQREFVARQAKDRDRVKARILEAAKKREAWLAGEEAKAGAAAGFDGRMLEMLRGQAADIAVSY